MLKKFISYYKPHRLMFALDMLASFCIAMIGMVYPIITRTLLNDLIPNHKLNSILLFSCLLLAIYVVRMFLKYFVQYYGHVIGVKMQAQMRRDMFTRLQKLPYSYYDEHETGKIMSRMTHDLMEISELAHHGPENLFICGLSVLASFVYLSFINIYLTLIVFSCVPLLVVISLTMRKRMNDAFMESRVSVGEINAALESSISGIRVTKAFNNSSIEMSKFEVGNEHFIEARKKAFKAMGQFSSSTSFVTDIFNVAVLLAGGLFLYNGSITFGDYSAFIVSVSMFITPLTTLINFVEMYESGVTGFKRFLEIMDEKEESEPVSPVVLEDVKGNIVFDDVSFSYANGQKVLDHISFKLEKGHTLALVGPSGGGKTTICHLLPHFYQYQAGKITIDGVDINDVSLESLRANIGIVQQDVFLFNGTIKENILYGRPEASDEEVLHAAKQAHIYEYVMKLPHGFDTQIGERGVKLSGGQKQRLSIARVFLKNPEILILDEATSALDNTTEVLIQQALDELAKGRTTIVVAHRLSTIKNADEIAVIANGQMIEMGTHDQLIEKEGIYAQLYKQQFREDEDSLVQDDLMGQ